VSDSIIRVVFDRDDALYFNMQRSNSSIFKCQEYPRSKVYNAPEITYLQFEFTGKYTNVIILDENNVVLEALRHVDLFASFREVRVGQKLLDVPPAPFVAKEYPLEDVEQFLYDVYEKEQNAKLANLKKQKIALLNKKFKKLQKLYDRLDSELQKEAQKYEHYG